MSLVLACTFQSFAQTGKITGTVVDENGETMPGVSVYIKGQPKSITTDIDGKFSLALPAGTYTLVFKFVSYKEIPSSEIIVKLNESAPLSVSMIPQDDSALTEKHLKRESLK